SRTRMAQTSFGRRGRFCPTRRPLFHGVRKGLLFELISMGMVDLHARPLHRIPRSEDPVVVTQQRRPAEPMPPPRAAALSQKAAESATVRLRQKRPFLNQLRTRQFDPCCSSSYGKLGGYLTRRQNLLMATSAEAARYGEAQHFDCRWACLAAS